MNLRKEALPKEGFGDELKVGLLPPCVQGSPDKEEEFTKTEKNKTGRPSFWVGLVRFRIW